MPSDVSLHVLYKIANVPIRLFPFPHIFVEEIFPQDFYREIRAHLPPREVFKTLKSLKRYDIKMKNPLELENRAPAASVAAASAKSPS